MTSASLFDVRPEVGRRRPEIASSSSFVPPISFTTPGPRRPFNPRRPLLGPTSGRVSARLFGRHGLLIVCVPSPIETSPRKVLSVDYAINHVLVSTKTTTTAGNQIRATDGVTRRGGPLPDFPTYPVQGVQSWAEKTGRILAFLRSDDDCDAAWMACESLQ